ncbi:Hypothetical protein PSEBR_m1194 [Pseudomonas brassicacearum subsp. brassicacearum NFM421]|uniref:Uncharacterized protein n=1 Tax=Pseudomonas brassicacearum (strain NFM421) TaxID=994484 RepID=F2KJG0_PSEBN|nr:Hypothetical protein PSEBR_m1194 [Pseudomonas brassicacearum subsp. brassicacearum NFM421]
MHFLETDLSVVKGVNAAIVSGILVSVSCPILVIIPFAKATFNLADPSPLLNFKDLFSPGSVTAVTLCEQSVLSDTKR